MCVIYSVKDWGEQLRPRNQHYSKMNRQGMSAASTGRYRYWIEPPPLEIQSTLIHPSSSLNGPTRPDPELKLPAGHETGMIGLTASSGCCHSLLWGLLVGVVVASCSPVGPQTIDQIRQSPIKRIG